MFEKITSYFISKPQRIKSLGELFLWLGMAILIAGMLGHMATNATGIIGSLAGQTDTPKTLEEIYPALPTWWIPESVFGAIPGTLLIVIGVWVNRIGNRLISFFKY